MSKEFDIWNNKKKYIQTDSTVRFFHEREIWWCSLGVNVGFEQDGKGEDFQRPILILKKFNNTCFLGVPLTSKIKSNKYYISIGDVDGDSAYVIISQVKFFDNKRLLLKIGTLNTEKFGIAKKAFIQMFE